MKDSKRIKRPQQELNEEGERMYEQAEKQHIRFLKHKHPDCIPIYYVKHKQASTSLKEPTTPFVLFKKDLKIQQAMYRLYQQIETKGLLFFCLHAQKEKAKYVKIKPGVTIEQVYNRFGRNQFLILIYGDSEMGMQGVKKMEKCLMWVLGILAAIWLFLFSYNYYLGLQSPSPTQNISIIEGQAGLETNTMQDIT